jgi:hypothetical protein
MMRFGAPEDFLDNDQSELRKGLAEQKIGLESHIRYQTRRRMIRLVMNHQRWSLHNNGFFDDDFLAKNCRSVSLHSTRMAQERALEICNFPEKDKPFLSAPLHVVMAR